MLLPANSFTYSYTKTLDPSGPATLDQLVGLSFGDLANEIKKMTISWFWNIQHGAAGPQNIASLSTIKMDVTPYLLVVENNNSLTTYAIRNSTDTADLVYNYTVVIDPVNGITDTSKRREVLELKNRAVVNGSVKYTDCTELFSNHCFLWFYGVYNPTGSSLGAGVTNANIYALTNYYSMVVSAYTAYTNS